MKRRRRYLLLALLAALPAAAQEGEPAPAAPPPAATAGPADPAPPPATAPAKKKAPADAGTTGAAGTDGSNESDGAPAPKAESPKAETPKADAPKADAPKAETPKTDAPKTDAPKADAPKADAPKGGGNPKAETVRPEGAHHAAPAGNAATNGGAGNAAAAAASGAGKGTKGANGKGPEKAVEKAPAAPAIAPEVAQKATKLKDEVNTLLAAEPGDARALESISTSGVDEKVYQAEPSLKPLLKLARARALTIQSRFDEASAALSDAKGLVDGLSPRESRRLLAQVRFRQGEVEEVRSGAAQRPSCGALGLARVSALEGRQARDRVERLAAKYKLAVSTGDRFWGRRAAFRTAMLYEDLYRFAMRPPLGYRGVALPRPFAVGAVDAHALVGDVLAGQWPAEISRLYSEVIASIDARDPDDTLLEQAKKRAAAFARLELPKVADDDAEKAQNPWFKDETPGLVRFNRRFEKRAPDGGWVPIDPKAARDLLLTNLQKGPNTIDHAYALVALAETGPAPQPAQILAGLGATDDRVLLAGILAAEKAPDPSFLDPLVEIAARPAAKGAPKEAFGTLQAALFGTRERALLALRALAAKDRSAAEKILGDNRLPTRERAWVIAELGDGRLEYTLQSMASDRDPNAAATALYALYLAAGKNSLGYLRQSDAGIVGCVSKAIATIEAEPQR